jgi:hypothetical protein
MTRDRGDYELVKRLIAAGQNDCQISRVSGIPRTTVRDWRWGNVPHSFFRIARHSEPSECREEHDYRSLPREAYAYLLGFYLGDGYVARARRVWRLRIVSDGRYPGILRECGDAMTAVMPGRKVAYYQRLDSACVEVSMYSKHWPCLFPQHGVGRKHDRSIRLKPWQVALVDEAHEPFVRGLIHSDGCRVIANDRGVESIRYHFSNRSDDIKGLFCRSLDALGITWTRPDDRGIAIYRKAAVARLDEFVGPKF